MSHFKERKEKNCLNCNAQVAGRYCHVCGQENVEIEESFLQLASHFAYDIIHYDGKFWKTLKVLLLKPGFLTREYLRGKRASYLHPIRMYVFTSAVFFIVLFGFIIKKDSVQEASEAMNKQQVNERIAQLQDSLRQTKDSARIVKVQEEIHGLQLRVNKNDGFAIDFSMDDSTQNKSTGGKSKLPATIEEYEARQDSLPEADKDSWLESVINKKQIVVNSKYGGNDKRFQEDFLEKSLHAIPQIMFVTLPFLALVLWLLYVRRRKQYFYVDHLVLMVHIYIAIFISLLLMYGLGGLHSVSGWGIFSWLETIAGIYIFLYCFLAMRNFYRQGYIKTSIKYLMLLFFSSIIFTVVALAFFALLFFQM